MSVFTLVIPTLNRTDYLIEALNSLQTIYGHQLVIVNNAKHKFSVAESWNRGINCGFYTHGSQYVIVSNDDVLYHPDCINQMVKAAFKGHLFVNCQLLKDYRDLTSRWTQGGFSLFLISRECWEKVGMFDEAFRPAYFEDNDYFYRMKLAGISEYVSPHAGFHHRVNVDSEGSWLGWSTTFSDPEMKAHHREVMETNRNYYVDKWGGPPGEEKYTIPFNGTEKGSATVALPG